MWQSLRRYAAPWGFAAFVLVVAVLGRHALLPFVLGIMLAFVLAPAVDRLSRVRLGARPLPRFAAVIVLYVGILSALGLFFGVFLPRLSGDFAHLFREAPTFFQKVKTDYAPRASRWLDEQFPSEGAAPRVEGPRPEHKFEVREAAPGRWEVSLEGLELQVDPAGAPGQGRWVIGPRHDDPQGRFDDLLAQLARASESTTLHVLRIGQRAVIALVRGIARLVLVLMIAAFLLVDLARIHGFLRALVPEGARDQYDEVRALIERGLSGVIRGQFLICLVNAALTYVGLLLIHVKYPLLLALLAGGMSLIPVFGSILSSVPIVAVALVGGAGGIQLGRGFATLGWIIGIHLLEANLLNPKIVGNAAEIHPLVVVFALLVGEDAGGLVGALIAVPVASVVQTLFLYFFRRRRSAPAASIAVAPAAVESAVESAGG